MNMFTKMLTCMFNVGILYSVNNEHVHYTTTKRSGSRVEAGKEDQMQTEIVMTYAVYLLLSIALTVWVARTLFKSGRVFLVDVFRGDEAIADSVNQLLVVGFYLINLGYISLMLKISDPVTDARQGIEALVAKMGLVLLMLGGMHFFNLFLFSKIRSSALNSRKPMPVGEAPMPGYTPYQ